MNNDRFKFRVWDDGQKIFLDDEQITISQDGTLYDIEESARKYLIIEQCTGLSAVKSYRGVKPEDLLIFEGDIIEGASWRNTVLLGCAKNAKFVNAKYQIIYCCGSVSLPEFTFRLCKDSKMLNTFPDIRRVEIIGNIHESEGK